MDALWHQRAVWWQTPPRADTAGFGWEPHWHSPRLTHGPSTAPTNRSFSPLGFASPGSKHRQRRTQPTPLPPLHLQPPFLSAPAPERYTNSFRLVFHPKSNFTQLREAKQGPQLPLRNNDASLKPALTHQLLQSQSSSQQSEVALAPTPPRDAPALTRLGARPRSRSCPRSGLCLPQGTGCALRTPTGPRSVPCPPPAPLRSSPPRAAAASWCPAAPPFKSPAPRNGRNGRVIAAPPLGAPVRRRAALEGSWLRVTLRR